MLEKYENSVRILLGRKLLLVDEGNASLRFESDLLTCVSWSVNVL